MKKIAEINYRDVKFKFISNHWDFHLNGTCLYNDELCEFKSKYPDYNEELDEWDEIFVEIYSLTFREKSKWLLRQWRFEKCVGYHWTYKDGKKQGHFYYRNPKWLYQKIFKLYYKLKKKK